MDHPDLHAHHNKALGDHARDKHRGRLHTNECDLLHTVAPGSGGRNCEPPLRACDINRRWVMAQTILAGMGKERRMAVEDAIFGSVA